MRVGEPPFDWVASASWSIVSALCCLSRSFLSLHTSAMRLRSVAKPAQAPFLPQQGAFLHKTSLLLLACTVLATMSPSFVSFVHQLHVCCTQKNAPWPGWLQGLRVNNL